MQLYKDEETCVAVVAGVSIGVTIVVVNMRFFVDFLWRFFVGFFVDILKNSNC